MRHNSSLIFSLQTKEWSIRFSPWCEGAWRQVRQLRGSFITAIGGRINWFYKYTSEFSILHLDKSFLNIICCHCLSNFIATSCPKGVYDSHLTGLTVWFSFNWKVPQGVRGNLLSGEQVGVAESTSMNSLKYYPHHLSHLHFTLQQWLSFLFPILSQTCEISSFLHLPFILLATLCWLSHLSTQ